MFLLAEILDRSDGDPCVCFVLFCICFCFFLVDVIWLFLSLLCFSLTFCGFMLRLYNQVALADEAIRIGPPPAVDSYLRGDVILDAAKRSGAEVIFSVARAFNPIVQHTDSTQ